MLTILGQAYLPIDHYVDIKKFDNILDDIILGISKSYYAIGPTNTGPGYLDKSRMSVQEIYKQILEDINHPYHNTIKSLKNWEPLNFIKFKWPSHTLGQCLILRAVPGAAYLDKDDETKCIDYPIKENFKIFLQWLDEQRIFLSIGRIVIFLNETGTSVLEHRDYVDGMSRKDQFIWISPLGNKKFYVRDEIEKSYFNSRCCYFDNANIHGSDVVVQSSFTIRIDGKFTQDFISKVGLEEHFSD